MKNKDIKGVIHDLSDFCDWKNPLNNLWIKKIYKIDLIKGKINLTGEDSIISFLKNKRKWFKERIKKLNGNLKDFEKAIITIKGAKEKIEIAYKGNKFKKERIYGEWMERQRKLKKELEKLKPIKINLKC